MDKIKIGDAVSTKWGSSNKITGIALFPPDATFAEDGMELTQIWTGYKDNCLFDLDNGHWAYGDQVSVIPQETTNS